MLSRLPLSWRRLESLEVCVRSIMMLRIRGALPNLIQSQGARASIVWPQVSEVAAMVISVCKTRMDSDLAAVLYACALTIPYGPDNEEYAELRLNVLQLLSHYPVRTEQLLIRWKRTARPLTASELIQYFTLSLKLST